MHVSLQPPPLPLTEREDGVIRIGGTRVTLDTLVYAFREGCSPEAIAEQYPAVSLSDIYAAISFFLSRQEEVDAYLAENERKSTSVRTENERLLSPGGVQARLLSRQNADACTLLSSMPIVTHVTGGVSPRRSSPG
jgi:uncharacterized protein (DUF433 family)